MSCPKKSSEKCDPKKEKKLSYRQKNDIEDKNKMFLASSLEVYNRELIQRLEKSKEEIETMKTQLLLNALDNSKNGNTKTIRK